MTPDQAKTTTLASMAKNALATADPDAIRSWCRFMNVKPDLIPMVVQQAGSVHTLQDDRERRARNKAARTADVRRDDLVKGARIEYLL